jgi:hypothetical protein
MLFDWMNKYSNWGRWGRDDSLGSMNTVTTRMRLKAADLVKLGLTVTTARRPYNQPFDPQLPRDAAFPSLAPRLIPPNAVDDTNPFFLWMNPPNYTSDRWNLAMAGAVLGWKLVLLAFFLAPLLALLPGLIVLATTKSHEIPYGPFLSLALIVAMVSGPHLMDRLGFTQVFDAGMSVLWHELRLWWHRGAAAP